MSSKQSQTGGDNSTNVQAVQVVINQGLSYSEVKDVAVQVFKENFLQLSGSARETASARGEKITDEFLQKLQSENPEGFNQAQDPDFQHALFTVQKEYARCGDEELGKLLVDLLVDRSKQPSRSILQITLNEALGVAPKLTADHLAALSIMFVFRNTINYQVGDMSSLGTYLDKYISPFHTLISNRDAGYQHLVYAGCGTISIGSKSLVSILKDAYGGIFSKGFTSDQFLQKVGTALPHPMVNRCLNNKDLFQVWTRNEKELRDSCAAGGVSNEIANKLVALHMTTLLSDAEIRALVEEIRPFMKHVFDVWEQSAMKSFTLTSVGIAIGHSNVKKNTGEFANLAIWIN